MTDGVRNKRWNVMRRLEFIEFRLYWEGRLNRRDLIEVFGISTPQATSDLKQYSEIAGHNLEYDSVERAYVAPQQFTPVFTAPLGNHYLAQLRLLANNVIRPEETWLGEVPEYGTIPPVTRRVEADRLRRVIQAIRERRALHIEYQSLKRDEPIWRWVSPHALGFNGARWHVRAWCHKRNNFQDFLFARTLDIGEDKETDIDGNQDREWHTFVTFKIGPHPDLSPAAKRAIEMDYDMRDGIVEVKTRIALSYYFERRLNFDLEGTGIRPERQQIVWLNRAEIEGIRQSFMQSQNNSI